MKCPSSSEKQIPSSAISPAERQQRKEAVEYANASIQLEGFELSPEMIRRQQLFIDGIVDSSGLTEGHESKEN